tara:strand:- start:1817 stop:2647 length:831 start_codon:yes stop_codon:yes gene_type:complete
MNKVFLNPTNQYYLSPEIKTKNHNENPPKIAFIVPYRDREQQLLFFQRQMTYILEDYPKDDYEIVICHQKDNRSFNCGAMKNIGFLILKNKYPNTYQDITLVFNDVDTMPFNKNFIPYDTKEGKIKHFYGFNHTLGGIVSIKASDFEKINGYPNFWAWGYEDNMLYDRAKLSHLQIDRSVFYPFADKNILHFYDGYLKQVNKREFERYAKNTMEGIYSIFQLQYNFNDETKLYDISSFETGINENKDFSKLHDLHNGTSPFPNMRNRGRPMMSFKL